MSPLNRKLSFILVSVFFFLSLVSSAYPISRTLAEELNNYVLASEAANSADVSIYVADSRGVPLYQYNSTMPLSPASNLKIFTAAAALYYLGSDYKYTTCLYGTPIDKTRGVMESSLYLVGSGDPTFCEPFMDNPTQVLEEFASELACKGLRLFTGDIIGDDSVFDREFLGLGWKDRYMLDTYAAQCAGLSLNANLIQITMTDGVASFFPNTSIINLIDKTVERPYTAVKVTRKRDSNDVTISGALSPYESGGALIPIHNPSLFTLDAFENALREQSIYNTGETKLISEINSRYKYSEFVELARHESPKMIDILIPMMKDSDNFLAQHIFKTIGAEQLGKGSRENASKAVFAMLEDAGVSVENLVLADGCGLSEENKTTAKQLGELLVYMFSSDKFADFIKTMPQSGVDGTLKYRMSNIKVRAKTGSINNVSALSGYVETLSGDTVVFSIISNNHQYGASVYKGFEDNIVNIIANNG